MFFWVSKLANILGFNDFYAFKKFQGQFSPQFTSIFLRIFPQSKFQPSFIKIFPKSYQPKFSLKNSPNPRKFSYEFSRDPANFRNSFAGLTPPSLFSPTCVA